MLLRVKINNCCEEIWSKCLAKVSFVVQLKVYVMLLVFFQNIGLRQEALHAGKKWSGKS